MSDAPPDEEAPPSKNENRVRRRALRGLRAVFSGAGATVAAIAGAIALAFSLWPSLSPDPGTNLSATIKVRSLEPGVRYDDYLQRTFDRSATVDGAASGTLVSVQINVAGRKHSGLRLYQYLYHLSNRRRLPDQPPSDAKDAGFEADTPSDQWIQPVWITYAGEENVFARIELYDGKTMLAFVDTKNLDGPRAIAR